MTDTPDFEAMAREKHLCDVCQGCRDFGFCVGAIILREVDAKAFERGLEAARGTPFEWRRVNDEPFEFAIRQGRHGDEFIKTTDGECLRRAAPNTRRPVPGGEIGGGADAPHSAPPPPL
jgi:hypothetical protein